MLLVLMVVALTIALALMIRGVIPMIDVSAGRTTPFEPPPGFAGSIVIQGVSQNLTKWTPRIRGEPVDATNFNSPRDPINGVIHKEWVPGSVDGEFTIEGLRDFSVVGWNPMPGGYGTAEFLYDVNLGFDVAILVIDIGGEQDANRAGMFTATVKTNGYIEFLGRNETIP